MRIFGLKLRLSQEAARELHEDIEEMSQPTWGYYGMVGLSGIIAAYGLLAGNTAVVIGAMLVAPLMSPIFGIALGLAIGDRKLLVRAVLSEVLGIVVVIGLSFLIGLAPLRPEFGTIILMRTQPTLYDMIVGLAAGLAGAYAIVSERISVALAGVAIAVAVVPPLAVAGLCLAAGRLELAGGAMLLFTANFLAIEVAAAFLLTAYGLVSLETDLALTFGDFFRRFSVSLLALAAIAYFMTNTLTGIIHENQLSDRIETVLSREIRETSGARLDTLDWHEDDGTLEILAAAMTPKELGPSEVRAIEKALEAQLLRKVNLTLSSLISKNYDRNGPVFMDQDELERRRKHIIEVNFRDAVTQAVKSELGDVPGATLDEIRHDTENGQDHVLANVRTPTAIQPEKVAVVEERIRQQTGRDVQLVIRSIITRDASAEQFVYEPKKAEPHPPSAEEVAMRTRLEEALRNQLAQAVAGSELQEMRYTKEGDRFVILTVARTPAPITPEQVAQIQENLRQYVNPAIQLVVRSNVGATASPSEYVTDTSESELLKTATD
ncbi:MAG: TIGR00341 family protein [Armatimonadota bacterium]